MINTKQTKSDTLLAKAKLDFFLQRRYLIQASVYVPFRVTRLSEDHCQIEVMLILSSMTEEEVKTELKCVAQNRGGRQEAVTQLRLEGDLAFCYDFRHLF